MLFQSIYNHARGLVQGEWSAKYGSGIISVVFALSVAIVPMLALLFVTVVRSVYSLHLLISMACFDVLFAFSCCIADVIRGKVLAFQNEEQGQ